MLPRLHAEEQLAAIQVATVGSGHLPKADAMRALNRLESRATGNRRRLPPNPAMLAAMGIAVVEVPAAPEASDG